MEVRSTSNKITKEDPITVNYLRLLYTLTVITLFFSCDTLELDTTDDEPIFTLEMTMDGEPILFAAGDDEYFMATEMPLLLPKTTYSGHLLKRDPATGVPDDRNSILMQFRLSEAVRNSVDLDHLNSFSTGRIPFFTNDPAKGIFPEIEFTNNYIGTGDDLQYEWDFGDGDMTDFSNPVHDYKEVGEYQVRSVITDSNQCKTTAVNTIKFGDHDNCIASIDITALNQSDGVLEARSTSAAALTFNWSTGETTSDIAIDFSNLNGAREYCVTITDADGCESVSCVGITKNGSNVNSCTNDFSEAPVTNSNTAWQFNSVQISYFNENGVDDAESRTTLQPADAYFEILSFEEYERDNMGQRVVKIDFEFSCTLTGLVTRKIENAKGSFAVAIPD